MFGSLWFTTNAKRTVNDVFVLEVVIKRATIYSQQRMMNLTNALAIQLEERDTD